MGTRFLPATKAVPKELLPIGDTPMLQIIIDEALGAGIDHIVVVVVDRPKPAHRGLLRPDARGDRRARVAGPRRARRTDAQHRVGLAGDRRLPGPSHWASATPSAAPREAVGDEPFAVLLPDELMGELVAARPDERRVRQLRRQRRRRSSRCPTRRSARTASSSRCRPSTPTAWSPSAGMVEKPEPADGAERPRSSSAATC